MGKIGVVACGTVVQGDMTMPRLATIANVQAFEQWSHGQYAVIASDGAADNIDADAMCTLVAGWLEYMPNEDWRATLRAALG